MSLLETAKQNNQTTGIIICIVITFVIYAAIPRWYGFILFRDFDFSVGLFVGLLFTFRFRTEDQSLLKFGITTGLIAGGVSSIAPGFLMWILFGGHIFFLFIDIGFLLITGLILGFIIGGLLGWYYMNKDMKEKDIKEKDTKDEYGDDFFQDLIEK